MQRAPAIEGTGPIGKRQAGAGDRLTGWRAAMEKWRAQSASPVEFNPRLMTVVGGTALTGLVVAWTTVSAPGDAAGLVVVSLVIFLMAVSSVRLAANVAHVFTASSFLAVGLAMTMGPVGALAAAAGEALGMWVRYRSGWFRFVFNLSTLFISVWVAWLTYHELTRVPVASPVWLGVVGLTAGIAFHVVNYLCLGLVLWASTGRPVIATLRGSASVLPYNVAYGYAGIGFVVLHERYGSVGFTFSLAPVIALQAFLLVFALRVRQHEAQREELLENLREKSVQVERSYDATLVALTHALDARDKETEGHSRRVVEYTRLLAVRLGIEGDDLKLLCHGALLHDIGKIGVPDAILHKPAALTEEEWQVMRRHPEIGAAMVEEVEYLNEARRIILHHHERWDGRGYPYGLKGTQIHIGARAFAVADTLDAITQDRPYRRGRSFDEAREEILRVRGEQFDPDVVDAFMDISEAELLSIAAIRSRVSVDLLTGRGTGRPRRRQMPERLTVLAR